MLLTRQRVVLDVMRRYGKPVSRLQLTKWLFLFAHEAPYGSRSAIYQFVPYKFGPYSFTLMQEAATLLRYGYIEAVDDHKWRLTQEGRDYELQLPSGIRRNSQEIVSTYGKLDLDELLDIVYSRYPWFTINAEYTRAVRPARPVAPIAIYTIGYEGFLVDGFLNALLIHGVKRVIDVRHNPTSRRYGFHKVSLSRICRDLSLEYEHIQELGIPASERSNLSDTASYQNLFAAYERDTLPAAAEITRHLGSLVAEKPSVLVCLEADPNQCHRSRLATFVSRHVDLPVRHLEWPR